MKRFLVLVFVAFFINSCAFWDDIKVKMYGGKEDSSSQTTNQPQKIIPDWTTLFVVDVSGSMNEYDSSGLTRLGSAKEVVTSIVDNISTDKTRLGLLIFGRSCQVFSIENNFMSDKKEFNNTINSLQASGSTPLAKAIMVTANEVKTLGKNVNVIILSDGEETCDGNPEYALEYFIKTNPDVKINIYTLGYGVDKKAQNQLKNIVYGKGRYAYVANKDELVRVLEVITNELMINEFYKFSIHFDNGRYAIKKSFDDSVKDFADYVKANDSDIILQGHTDSTGTAKSNLVLSNKRANAVKSRLIKLGVKADKIQIQGFGDTRPVDTNQTDEGRSKNRRVDMIAIDKK